MVAGQRYEIRSINGKRILEPISSPLPPVRSNRAPLSAMAEGEPQADEGRKPAVESDEKESILDGSTSFSQEPTDTGVIFIPASPRREIEPPAVRAEAETSSSSAFRQDPDSGIPNKETDSAIPKNEVDSATPNNGGNSDPSVVRFSGAKADPRLPLPSIYRKRHPRRTQYYEEPASKRHQGCIKSRSL